MRESFKVEGDKRLAELFAKLPQRLADRVLRTSTQSAGLPIERAMRSSAPVDTGLLRRSMTRKTKYYRHSMLSITMIGPRSMRIQRTRSDGSPAKTRGGRALFINPAKYINPVNAGHNNPKAKNFVRRAFNNALPEARSRFEHQFARGLFREIDKLK